MTLKCEIYYRHEQIPNWVRNALELNVRHLILAVSLLSPELLFQCINGCKTLVRLELEGDYRLQISRSFTLPNLKRLYLSRLSVDYFHGGGSIKELIDGCPQLEDLHLSLCRMMHLKNLHIQSPLLKKLIIEISWKEIKRNFVIDAPNLQVLKCLGFPDRSCSVSNFNSLVVADIGVAIVQPINACSSTTRLCLAACSTKALHGSSVPLATFQNLTWLALHQPGLQLLAHFLGCAPNLEKLTVEMGPDKYEGTFEDFERLVPRPPICLELHVKEIEYVRSKKLEEDEMRLMEYFLKNGKTLQKLSIWRDDEEDESISERLQMFPTRWKILDFKEKKRIYMIPSDFDLAREKSII